MQRRIYIAASVIGNGAIYGAIAGGVSSAVIAMVVLASDPFGIVLGCGFGMLIGFFGGGILGIIVGAAAAVIIMLLDFCGGSKALYKLSLMTVCPLLTFSLVLTQAQRFFDFTQPSDRMIIYALTGFATLSALVISFIFANYSRKIFYLPNDDQPPAA